MTSIPSTIRNAELSALVAKAHGWQLPYGDAITHASQMCIAPNGKPTAQKDIPPFSESLDAVLPLALSLSVNERDLYCRKLARICSDDFLNDLSITNRPEFATARQHCFALLAAKGFTVEDAK